ncbi:hypothetical protein [Altericista sp. CCNU0014]|uniref:hypothetical protein n=1 Tax=Altericista sp. CCNU0014 TaxID=3082949 RepID=UPI00384E3124
MQASSYRFIGKVVIVSGLISFAIKAIGPQLAIPKTPTVAMVLVLLPAILMGLALGLQYSLQRR